MRDRRASFHALVMVAVCHLPPALGLSLLTGRTRTTATERRTTDDANEARGRWPLPSSPVRKPSSSRAAATDA
uniref:Putative secreted protein n=1 Tax=Ixodes ricinus TaxID=34613 RepID=A0A6B0TSL6_IXORI